MTRYKWYKGNGQYYIADIFARNGKLVLICPLYGDHTPDIKVVGVNPIHDIIRGPVEPIRILVYEYISEEISITVDGQTRRFTVYNETVNWKYKLVCTTLFLHDYELIPLWYEWYKSRGVEHFYLYYNGPKLPSDIFTAPEITYILWDFKYWNGDISETLDWMHHAQPLQMNHALWKYGLETEYMIFADLDEYMLLIAPNGEDRIVFASHWARTLNGKIPKERVTQNVIMDRLVIYLAINVFIKQRD